MGCIAFLILEDVRRLREEIGGWRKRESVESHGRVRYVGSQGVIYTTWYIVILGVFLELSALSEPARRQVSLE